MTAPAPEEAARPGPRRPPGAPAGPEAVRRAVIDSAAELFSRNGINQTSLRDIAAAAHVNVGLISRYIGNRDDLVIAVVTDLGEQVGRLAVERPLKQQGWDVDSPMGRWARVAGQLAVDSPELLRGGGFNPVEALATVIQASYGLDQTTARIRGAQIVASAVGWRLLETYLIDCAGPTGPSKAELRDALTDLHRQIGATPWP